LSLFCAEMCLCFMDWRWQPWVCIVQGKTISFSLQVKNVYEQWHSICRRNILLVIKGHTSELEQFPTKCTLGARYKH
jgi:hypothetical protein